MKSNINARWEMVKDSKCGFDAVVLILEDNDQPGQTLKAWIVPEHGSNLCRFSVGEHNIIDFDGDELVSGGFTGTPVLYPTPNRVRDGIFTINGIPYEQKKNGQVILNHGLVHNEKWESAEPVVKEDCICFDTWIDFKKDSPIYEAFPFEHRLQLQFCLNSKGIRISYTIKNFSNQTIPFGFGLHPYFMKLSGPRDTVITVPADVVMESTPDLLPTGKLIDVTGSKYDLRQPISIGDTDLDHVYAGIASGEFSIIEYKTLGLNVKLIATSEFSHIVVYSPKGMEFFCIENQTCSTDAHNMHEKGYNNEAGLEFVEAQGEFSGYVEYIAENDKI